MDISLTYEGVVTKSVLEGTNLVPFSQVQGLEESNTSQDETQTF
jgi:hypothetical protein